MIELIYHTNEIDVVQKLQGATSAFADAPAIYPSMNNAGEIYAALARIEKSKTPQKLVIYYPECGNDPDWQREFVHDAILAARPNGSKICLVTMSMYIFKHVQVLIAEKKAACFEARAIYWAHDDEAERETVIHFDTYGYARRAAELNNFMSLLEFRWADAVQRRRRNEAYRSARWPELYAAVMDENTIVTDSLLGEKYICEPVKSAIGWRWLTRKGKNGVQRKRVRAEVAYRWLRMIDAAHAFHARKAPTS